MAADPCAVCTLKNILEKLKVVVAIVGTAVKAIELFTVFSEDELIVLAVAEATKLVPVPPAALQTLQVEVVKEADAPEIVMQEDISFHLVKPDGKTIGIVVSVLVTLKSTLTLVDKMPMLLVPSLIPFWTARTPAPGSVPLKLAEPTATPPVAVPRMNSVCVSVDPDGHVCHAKYVGVDVSVNVPAA